MPNTGIILKKGLFLDAGRVSCHRLFHYKYVYIDLDHKCLVLGSFSRKAYFWMQSDSAITGYSTTNMFLMSNLVLRSDFFFCRK